MTDKPKPFPEWNRLADIAPPMGEQIVVAWENGTQLILRSYDPSSAKDWLYWMYAPEHPKGEPKRGVWTSIDDELPPIGLNVLIKYPWGTNFRQARRVEEKMWVFSDSDYDNVGGIISHWYLPHEFGG
jgi:hypothetical protein